MRVQSLWKESASLIVLAKNKAATKGFNYNVLMFKRSEKTSFMPNHAVFPGGVKESVDESMLWLKYLKKFGIQDKFLNGLVVQGPRPGIFKKSGPKSIEKEIALRITALRETFEEVGLFLCRGKDNLNIDNEYGAYTEEFDRKHWQEEVHNDPTKFLHMCEELNVVPDLWSLNEWSVWLTPASARKRFETAFYLVAVNNTPNLLCEEQEVTEIMWKNPMEYFDAYRNDTVWLPPPQVYELSRLASICEIEKLQKFASERNSKGSTLFLPVKHQCNNGLVGILPGDEDYPDNPNECTQIKQIDENADEYCSKVKKCHRTIYSGPNECGALLNFESFDGHLKPIDVRKTISKL